MSTTADEIGTGEERRLAVQRERQLASKVALDRMRNTIRRRVGVTIDVARLDEKELRELYGFHEKLTKTATWAEPGLEDFRLSTLSGREQARWRELVSKAAGEPGLFERTKRDGALLKQLRELAALTRPQQRIALPSEGAVVLPPVLFELLNLPNPKMSYTDVGLLGAIATTLENGRSVFYGGHVESEGEERVLVMPRGSSWGYQADEDSRVGVEKPLRLAEQELLVVSEQGGERRVRYGLRPLTAWRTKA